MTKPSIKKIFLGSMTGTSMDGMDLVAVKFDDSNKLDLLHKQYSEYPLGLKKQLTHLALNENASISDMCKADTELGSYYAKQINHFLESNKIPPKTVAAIGSHGQTLRHQTNIKPRYTLQIGDPNIIAAKTGISVVADFRRRDLALDGEGAPLAPTFHQHIFRSSKFNRAIINIGGIANITLLPSSYDIEIKGFDTGPGNTLLDHLSKTHLKSDYDKEGNFARSGKIHHQLLFEILKNDPFLNKVPPKSTGTDYFSSKWLKDNHLMDLKPEDSMATALEITAVTITDNIKNSHYNIDECYVCGGGSHNKQLMNRLQHLMGKISVTTTNKLGIDPDWVEAITFAWLAKQTLEGIPGNTPSVTNAEKASVLGGIFPA